MNNCINKIQIDDLNKIIKEIRYFFKKYGFIELSTYEYNFLDTITIPKSIITYNHNGTISSLKQTNIFTLEKYLLENETVIGFFSLNHFIKPISNNNSYPTFEFVMRNNIKTNYNFLKNLIKHFGINEIVENEIFDDKEQNKIIENKNKNFFLLKNFYNNETIFNKNSSIKDNIYKLELYNSSLLILNCHERKENNKIIKEKFLSIDSKNKYNHLINIFNKNIIHEGINNYVSLKLIPRIIGNIDIFNLWSCLKLCKLLNKLSNKDAEKFLEINVMNNIYKNYNPISPTSPNNNIQKKK